MGGIVSSQHKTAESGTSTPTKGPYFLDAKNCKLLAASWPYVNDYGPEKVGMIAFKKLFIVAPETFTTFSSFCDDPNWETSSHFIHHCRVVVAVIGASIKTLKTPTVLCPHLEFLGFQHKLRDIHARHFAILGEAFIEALEIACKPGGKEQWNPEIKAAWADLCK